MPPAFALRQVADVARVDLSLPAAQRWAQAAAQKPGGLKALVDSAESLIRSFGRAASAAYGILSPLAYPFYARFGNYIDEGLALADAEGQSRAATTILQRLYTLGYLAKAPHAPRPGCTTCVIEHVESGAKRHFRSLDWPMVGAMGKAAQVHEFYGRASDTRPQYTSAGMCGVLGLLSAAKPGFAVSINHAPQRCAASLHSDPLLLLRRVFDAAHIVDYRQAVEALSGKRAEFGVPGAPVFYVVSGKGRGEACVIEWSHAKEGCRVLDIGQVNASEAGGFRLLLQTNHYDETDSPFAKYNTAQDVDGGDADAQYATALAQSSKARRRRLRSALNMLLDSARGLPSVRELQQVYAEPPIFNYESAQWVSLDPASGELGMWVRQ
jgi:hypothetical protein